jgi:hypothetical protein
MLQLVQALKSEKQMQTIQIILVSRKSGRIWHGSIAYA